MDRCFVCAKHQDMGSVPGGEVLSDEHCSVETRRHVAELGDLTASEASSLGTLAGLVSAGLRDATGAEHVYADVIAPRGGAREVSELTDRMRAALRSGP